MLVELKLPVWEAIAYFDGNYRSISSFAFYQLTNVLYKDFNEEITDFAKFVTALILVDENRWSNICDEEYNSSGHFELDIDFEDMVKGLEKRAMRKLIDPDYYDNDYEKRSFFKRLAEIKAKKMKALMNMAMKDYLKKDCPSDYNSDTLMYCFGRYLRGDLKTLADAMEYGRETEYRYSHVA